VAFLTIALAALLVGLPGAVIGQSLQPSGNPSIQLTAEPMLGGRFEPGSWAAFRVLVENSGPALEGELRVAKPSQDGSTYSRSVQLAPGARQEHILYGQMGALNSRFVVSLVSGGAVQTTVNAPLQPAGDEPGVVIVAERPEPLVGLLDRVLGEGAARDPQIVALAPEQLPPRAEAWSAVDLLVWQDVDSNRLTGEQLEALRTWLTLGGDLVVVGGSTGISTLGAFPPDLLPFQPSSVVDVPTSDLQLMLGTLPPDATSLPALAGSLARGRSVGQSSNLVVAARTPVGQGSVAILGMDVSAPWLAASASANPFWSAAFSTNAAGLHDLIAADEGYIVDALGSLPSVQVPPFEMLALLLIAYVVAVGPLNYFALRRRDRREWAWVTMPLTIVVFALGAYGIGVMLKGGEVVVNQLAVVHGAAGSDRGLANVYVGVYSPSRATFDVNVGGNALLAAPVTRSDPFDRGSAVQERPIDVVLGEPSTVRAYSVGFGTLRGFRAQAAVSAPMIHSDLRRVEDALEGTITNASAQPLSSVAVVFGGAVSNVADMAPGETRPVTIDASRNISSGALWERLVPSPTGLDSASSRVFASRRALLQHLSGGWSDRFFFDEGFPVAPSGVFSSGPIVVAWQSGPTLEVGIGGSTEQVGERLYVIQARAEASGPTAFSGGLIQHRVIESEGVDTGDAGGMLYMGRGTVTVDYWPLSFEGAFTAPALNVELTRGLPESPSNSGNVLNPLPPEQQPDPNQPLAADSNNAPEGGMPIVQLYDRTAATWVEFEPLVSGVTYAIADPGRYMDGAGTVRARFVVRGFDEYAEFSFGIRLEGNIQ
jgi:hypothetical protein